MSRRAKILKASHLAPRYRVSLPIQSLVLPPEPPHHRTAMPIQSLVLPPDLPRHSLLEPSQNVVMPPKSASFLQRLPTEHRFMIWFLLLPDPRVVEFEWTTEIGWFCPRESSTSPSILLRINRETRGFYQKDWLSLAPSKKSGLDFLDSRYFKDRNRDFVQSKAPKETFNPKLDTLYISEVCDLYGYPNYRYMREIAADPCIHQLQFLALEHSFIKLLDIEENVKLFRTILEHMLNLERLTIVGCDPRSPDKLGKHMKRGPITFHDVDVELEKDRYAWGYTREAKKFLENFQFFAEHSEIIDHSFEVGYKRIYRGGVKMLAH